MARILTFDIESSLQVAYTFNTGWKVNLPYSNVIEEQYLLGYSYKWLDGEVKNDFLHNCRPMQFKKHDDKAMVRRLRNLLDKADIVITYNGDRFDIPLFNALCLKYGIEPPSKYKSVDLFKTVKRKFKLNSMKLEYVNKYLGYRGKDEMCFNDWIECHLNNVEAYEKMATYCDRDVIALEEAYIKIRPHIDNHPNISRIDNVRCCPKCGGFDYVKNGWSEVYASGYKRQRMKCNSCGTRFTDPNFKKKEKVFKPFALEK